MENFFSFTGYTVNFYSFTGFTVCFTVSFTVSQLVSSVLLRLFARLAVSFSTSLPCPCSSVPVSGYPPLSLFLPLSSLSPSFLPLLPLSSVLSCYSHPLGLTCPPAGRVQMTRGLGYGYGRDSDVRSDTQVVPPDPGQDYESRHMDVRRRGEEE